MLTNDKNTNIALIIIFSSYLLLLGVITLDVWQSEKHQVMAWILQAVPLLLLLPGLLQKHYRSYSWLCFLMLAYFTSYVVQVYSPSRDFHDWIALFLTVEIFVVGMFASRWLQRIVKGVN